jgi:hypothetical protein
MEGLGQKEGDGQFRLLGNVPSTCGSDQSESSQLRASIAFHLIMTAE